MKKQISVVMVLSLVFSAFSNVLVDASSADTYFADARTVDYSTVWSSSQNKTNYASTEAETAKYEFSVIKDNDPTYRETFSLLDVKDNSSSKYFVITSNPYVCKTFTETNLANYFAMDGDVTYSSNDDRANTCCNRQKIPHY